MDNKEWYSIVEAAGPDRVSDSRHAAGRSASGAAPAREYFRCVREDGMMVWLYHGMDHLDHPGQQTSDWFLHGWWD